MRDQYSTVRQVLFVLNSSAVRGSPLTKPFRRLVQNFIEGRRWYAVRLILGKDRLLTAAQVADCSVPFGLAWSTAAGKCSAISLSAASTGSPKC